MNEGARRVSYFLRCRVENAGDQRGHAVPLLCLGMELTPTGCGQPIELCFALIFGFAPLTRDQSLMFQPVQGWVQRSLLDLQRVAGDLLDTKQNPVAMQWAQRDSFENQHVESALQQINSFRHALSLHV